MKRALLIASLICAMVPLAVAQKSEEHGEFGVFGDYTRMSPINTNFYGVGGRVSFNAGRYFQLEGQTTYDFAQSFSSNVPCLGGAGCIPTLSTGSVHLWDALFGPKIQTRGPVKFFVTAKGGFINFAGGNPSFPAQVSTFGGSNTYGVFYPGGGLEAFLGPVGLRLDVGDEIYFNNGAQNNLKIQFGPHFRF